MHLLQWTIQRGGPPTNNKLLFDTLEDLVDYVHKERIREYQYIFIPKYSKVQILSSNG